MSTISTNELESTLYRLNKLLRRLAHHAPREHGLHHGQRALLQVLLEHDGASQRDLCDLLDVRPSSLAEALARLEQAGWVSRRAAENDQRVQLVSLTDAGHEAAQAAGTDELSNRVFACLTPEETEQFKAITEKICANLEGLLSEDCGGHHGCCGEHHGHHGVHHDEHHDRHHDRHHDHEHDEHHDHDGHHDGHHEHNRHEHHDHEGHREHHGHEHHHDRRDRRG